MPKETITSLKQQNQSLKQQVDALCQDVKSLKESFAATEAVNENRIIAVTNASNVETARSLQYLSDEYDDLSASNSRVSVQLKQISHRLNVLSAQVERVANAINDAEEYSYQFNVKIIGLPEMNSSETAPKTSSLCVKLVQEMGTEVSILDIDITHRVSTRNEGEGPKPLVCKFVRRLAKGKVMKVCQRASEVNPTSIGLSAENEHCIHEIKTKGYDVSGVNLFLPKLMKFLPKKGVNFIPPILLSRAIAHDWNNRRI